MTDKNNTGDHNNVAHPSYQTTDGYLKCWCNYQQRANDSWENATKADRKLTLLTS